MSIFNAKDDPYQSVSGPKLVRKNPGFVAGSSLLRPLKEAEDRNSGGRRSGITGITGAGTTTAPRFSPRSPRRSAPMRAGVRLLCFFLPNNCQKFGYDEIVQHRKIAPWTIPTQLGARTIPAQGAARRAKRAAEGKSPPRRARRMISSQHSQCRTKS